MTRDGKDYVFHPSNGLMMGFSDTLWYGRDHFSTCHNLEGLRVVVRYKPGDGTGPNDLLSMEIRVDVPTAPAKVDQATTAAKQ
jgi:hypothetical protein